MIDLRFVPIQQWPGRPTKARQNARFRAHYNDTLDKLETELKHLRAKAITVEAFYTHGQIRNDGWPRVGEKPQQPGVIVSFTTGQRLSFPCDRYHFIEDNLRAIALSLEALRAVDRYGVTKRAEQYQGWKQIQARAPTFKSREDAAVFIVVQTGSAPTYSLNRVRTVIEQAEFRHRMYREAAKRLHPDNPNGTGDHELFVRLQDALKLLEGGQNA